MDNSSSENHSSFSSLAKQNGFFVRPARRFLIWRSGEAVGGAKLPMLIISGCRCYTQGNHDFHAKYQGYASAQDGFL